MAATIAVQVTAVFVLQRQVLHLGTVFTLAPLRLGAASLPLRL